MIYLSSHWVQMKSRSLSVSDEAYAAFHKARYEHQEEVEKKTGRWPVVTNSEFLLHLLKKRC